MIWICVCIYIYIYTYKTKQPTQEKRKKNEDGTSAIFSSTLQLLQHPQKVITHGQWEMSMDV